VRLVACPSCKTHLDVTANGAAEVTCPCGTRVITTAQEGLAATVRRCAGCGASLDERATSCSYCQSAIVREPQRLTLVCPECLCRNPENGRFCTACGIEFLPQAPLAEATRRECPACTEPLVSERMRDLWIFACSGCDGVWVPAPAFDALMKRIPPAVPAPSQGLRAKPAGQAPGFETAFVYRRCPECREPMVRRNFGRTSGVVVDWCGAHGTWFDADELGRVAAFIAAGGLEKAAESAREKADGVRILLRETEHKESPWAALLETIFAVGR
jgi:Zn-finger nucleic acid-binding protein